MTTAAGPVVRSADGFPADAEWLVANGLGGFASAHPLGALERRYHVLLAAALPPPFGRMAMLSHAGDRLRAGDGADVPLSVLRATDPLPALESFRLEDGLPVWRFRVGGAVLEKRLAVPYRRNAVVVRWTLVEGGPATLALRPLLHVRGIHDAVAIPATTAYTAKADGNRLRIAGPQALPELGLRTVGQGWRFDPATAGQVPVHHPVEAARGYDNEGQLWCPGELTVPLSPGVSVALVAGTDGWEVLDGLDPDGVLAEETARRRQLVVQAPAAKDDPVAAELVLAADSFLIQPVGRAGVPQPDPAAGATSVIAGYPWFTDWGRDTMIALEGLTLPTGRAAEAAGILTAFARHVRRGLIPNLFPEGSGEGVYHTADATPWFVQALARYVATTGDRETLRRLLPTLVDILEHHRNGTDFGIGMDPADGLLRQGAPGYQLTWMDAKVGDWVVTPRRGKAVEINALWYNALMHVSGWLAQEWGGDAAAPWHDLAARAKASFNARFWYADGGHLYDVVDGEAGDDPTLRPNQIFALSLDHPVLDESRWALVLEAVRRELLTPVGLRSLAPSHPDYIGGYGGDLRTRDAAYHQGTVWSWPIGAYVDAYLRVHHGDKAGARALLDGLVAHLGRAGLGSVSEIFDGDPPFTPEGCFSQAWSVAELLRARVRTA